MTGWSEPVVRAWTEVDTETVVRWFREDTRLWWYMPGWEQAPSPTQIREHLASRLAQEAAGTALVLAVDMAGELACQFVIHPRTGDEGACHILVAPWAHGHGIALAQAAIKGAQERGLRKIVGIPSARLPQDVYERFMRRVGFTIKFYGEIVT